MSQHHAIRQQERAAQIAAAVAAVQQAGSQDAAGKLLSINQATISRLVKQADA